MLRYFPNIFPDELLYSAYSRYYIQTGNESTRNTFYELIGKKCNTLSLIDFPGYIDFFLNQFDISDFYTAEDIIFKYSMLPLFYPFLDEETQKYAIHNMKSCSSKNLYMKLGIMASSISCLKLLKYCPDCLKEDISTYRVAYLHRSHNLDGVFVCYKHSTLLRTNCPKCNAIILQKNKYQLISLESTCINGHDLTVPDIEENKMSLPSTNLNNYILISKIVNYILNLNVQSHYINFYTLHKKYLYKLDEMGLVTAKGLIRQKKLKQKFIDFYGSTILKSLKLEIDYDKNYCWLQEFVEKSYKAYHPLKHILFLIFICNNNENEIKNLLIDKGEYDLSLFGKAPWPCLNPLADHYLLNVISDYRITMCPKTHKPLGIFECSCGFIYTRDVTDNTENDRYKFKSIKSFGRDWEQKLSNIILNEGGSLHSIAKKMKCDRQTVIKYAYKLGLKFCWEVHSDYNNTILKDKSKTNNFEYLCNQYKNVIQNFIWSLPTPPKVYQIRKLFEKEYSYLYDHNKEMLLDILVACKTHKDRIYKNSKVNWGERDLELLPLVTNEINQLLESERLIRITINRIGSDLGISYILEQYIDKLPCTRALINASIETVEDYQIRRIKTIANRMEKSDVLLTKTNLYRIAGIKWTCTNRVKYEIEKLFEPN
jgi:hypothetical protein